MKVENFEDLEVGNVLLTAPLFPGLSDERMALKIVSKSDAGEIIYMADVYYMDVYMSSGVLYKDDNGNVIFEGLEDDAKN